MARNLEPNSLLDTIKSALNIPTDAALCRRLQFPAPVISKVRRRRLPVSADLLLSIHEETGWSFKQLRSLASGESVALDGIQQSAA